MKAGWRVVPLGEVCSVVNGGTPQSTVPDYWGGDVNWLTPKDMGQMDGRHIAETPRKITRFGLDNCSARMVPPGSVIMSTRAPIGHLAMNDVPMAFNQGCRGMVPGKHLDPVFLFHVLSANIGALNDLGTGTTFKELSASALKAFPIPLPPLDEQKRIVAVLDEAFEGLSRARANAEANLADAREVLENGINSLIASDPNAVETVLGALCSFENGDRGKNYPGRKAFVPTGVPFINAGHLLNGPIDWAEMNYIPLEHFHRLSNGKVKQGDLLFCLRGSLGKFGVVDSDEPGAIASSLVIVRPKRDRLHPSYLATYFKSKRCKDMIAEFENGAAQPNLSAKNLAAFKITLPSVLHQEKVVAQMTELEEKVGILVQLYKDQLSELDVLRQSLLQKAFSGELP